MRSLIFLFVMSCSVFVTQAQSEAEKIMESFLLTEEYGLFRGFDFFNYLEDIEDLEAARKNRQVDYIADEIATSIVYDLDLSSNARAQVVYFVDEFGLFYVQSEIYLESNALAEQFFQELLNYYSSLYGEASLLEDGWTEFRGEYEDEIELGVWILLDEDEDGDGKVVHYELSNESY